MSLGDKGKACKVWIMEAPSTNGSKLIKIFYWSLFTDYWKQSLSHLTVVFQDSCKAYEMV